MIKLKEHMNCISFTLQLRCGPCKSSGVYLCLQQKHAACRMGKSGESFILTRVVFVFDYASNMVAPLGISCTQNRKIR